MQTQYENQGGLLVVPGTNQCAGYIFNFEGRGAYQPIGKVETHKGRPKQKLTRTMDYWRKQSSIMRLR